MSEPQCPACGAADLRFWREATSAAPELTAHSAYPLQRCGACGSATLASDAQEPQLHDRVSAQASWAGPAVRMVKRIFDWARLRFLRGLDPGSTILEVGAGRGEMLKSLVERGHDASGVEPSPQMAEEARSRGLRIEQTDVDDLALRPQSGDAVIFWHVLEHLETPADALRSVQPWLKPGGRVFFAVPNLASIQASIGGDRWFHQDVPRHRTHLTPDGSRAMLERTGYGQPRVRFSFLEHGLLGMWVTLLNRLTAEVNAPYRLLKRELAYRSRGAQARDLATVVVVGLPAALVAIVLEGFACLVGRGGAMVVDAAALEPASPGRDRQGESRGGITTLAG